MERVRTGVDPDDGRDDSAHDDKSFTGKNSIDPSVSDDARIKLPIVVNLWLRKSDVYMSRDTYSKKFSPMLEKAGENVRISSVP